MVVLWDTAGVPWVSGNDASAPKPCLNPGSSSDEDFTGCKTASLAAVRTSQEQWTVGTDGEMVS